MQPIAIVSVEWDVVDLIESNGGYTITGFFDAAPDCAVGEFRYLGRDDAWSSIRSEIPDLKIALAIDHPAARARLFKHYGSAIVTLHSSAAYISPRAAVGEGSIVQRGVTVMPNAQIGAACKLNVNCTVHHDAKIGNFSTLAPGSQVLGNVTIEERAYVGAGAVIRQRCRIGEGAVVGAGAVVVEDVAPGAVVVGVPANRRLK
jgi:sugar O-acyltransferase (sialic acid O-acetyltransferase NeuD family)